MEFINPQEKKSFKNLCKDFKKITNYDIVIINNSIITNELNSSTKFIIITDIFQKYLSHINKENTEESNSLDNILFLTQKYIDEIWNKTVNIFKLKINLQIYYRNDTIILIVNDSPKELNILIDKKYYNRLGNIISINYKVDDLYFENENLLYYKENGTSYNINVDDRIFEQDLIEEFNNEIIIKSKIADNIISISSNLKQKFIRKDGKIAGPFDENKSTIPFTYFDNKYHELYNNNGLLYSRSITITEPTADEDLVSAIKSKEKIKPIYNDMIRLEKFDFSDVDEENLCQCSDCKFSRSLLKDNIKTNLIQKLELARELILKYDDKIPKFPDFFYIGVSLQKEILNILLNKIEKYEGLDSVLKIMPEYIKNKKDKIINESFSLEDKKLLLSKIINMQNKLLLDKNILLNLSIKKLTKYSIKQLNAIYGTFDNLYETSNKFKKIRKITLQPIEMNLSKKEINDNSIVSNSEGIENEEGLLNPEYNYIYVIKNGIIKGIYPINKK